MCALNVEPGIISAGTIDDDAWFIVCIHVPIDHC